MKILLVDDARSVVMVMKARLSGYGHAVVHAANGLEAVELFKEQAPDLVLMDLEMPIMNGYVATQTIRAFEATQQWAWTPIIFLTSSDSVDHLVQAIDAGADDFMSKVAPEPVLRAKMTAMSRIAALRQSLSQANRQLQSLAAKDGLTGLCNRRSMDQQTDGYWAEAVAKGQAMGLLMLDIDHFKKYNDHYGHQQGDDCLRQVARTIDDTVQACLREGLVERAFAARYGGEEFSVIVPHVTGPQLEALSERVVNAIRQLRIAHELNAEWGCVTVSVGGALAAPAAGKLGLLFRAADARLYKAKQLGRNRAVLH